jgi:hypothetical protein
MTEARVGKVSGWPTDAFWPAMESTITTSINKDMFKFENACAPQQNLQAQLWVLICKPQDSKPNYAECMWC